MNYCLINNVFPPILTGSSIFIFDLATELHKQGHNVVVITSKNEECNQDFELHNNGFKLFRINRIKLFRSSLWMKFPDFYFTLLPSNFKKIKKILIDNDIDIIHQCNNIFDLVFASAYYSKKLGIPLICSFMTQIQHSNRILNIILAVFDRIIIKHFFIRYVEAFIVGDIESKRYINNRYKIFDSIYFLHMGVSNLDVFAKVKRDYNKRNNLLVSVGHISHVKDRKELVLSLPIVKKRIPNAKIKIIGSLFCKKIERELSRHNVVDDVQFTGKVERNQIPKIISDVDIGSMFFSNVPYRKGVGTANIELMASGLPVILDAYEDNFGPDMPFKDGVHFVKLQSRDPNWIAEKIIELYENPAMRERIGKAGKKFVLEQLSWQNITPGFLKIYELVLLKYKQE